MTNINYDLFFCSSSTKLMEKIAAIKKGDVKVFTELFDASYQKTFSFFMSRTKMDRDLAKELTQLTYIKTWQSKHTLSEDLSLDHQLFVIARCILIDHLRKQASERIAKDEISRKSLSVVPAVDLDEQEFENSDSVHSLLKQLPPARKKVMQMKFIYGYSNREIAGMLSISIKTVEDHVTKGLRELRANPQLTAAYSLLVCLASGI